MRSKNRLLRLSLIACLVLGWVAYLPIAPTNVTLAETPLPPVEEIERAASLVAPTPTPIPQAETRLHAALDALEAARVEGPEAVRALGESLPPTLLDLVIDEVVAARERLSEASPPPPTAPVSEAEEQAILQALDAIEATYRALALTNFSDPAEGGSADATPGQPAMAPTYGATADRTVGNGCAYPTITAALMVANPGDTLLLEGGRTFTENITIPITLTVQGGYSGCASGSAARTTLDGNAGGPVVIVDRAIVVSLLNLNITNGHTGWEGGGIRFAYGNGTGTLNLTNMSIYSNTAQWGGGLWVGQDAVVNGENVAIYNNTATSFGGGARLFGGRATFVTGSIYDNIAPLGGGLYATRENDHAPVVNLTTSDLYFNQALSGDGLGGGVYLREGTLTMISDSDLIANDATHGGGAYLVTSTLTLDGESSWIYNNTATGNGGGVHAQDSTVNLDDSAQLYNNSAETGGGAYLENSSLWGDKASIRYNTANLRGGGVYATNGSVFDMDLGTYSCLGARCSRLSNNTATTLYGGGVYVGNNSVSDLRNTFVENNTADYGGGVYAYNNSTVYVYNSLFARNNAVSGTGDAIRLNLNATMTGAGNTLAYNDAGGAATGQAIGLTTSNLSLHCSIIWGHTNSIDTAGQNVTYSNIQGGYAGAGNLNVDPLFVAPASADFHLQAASPVIDRCAFFSGMGTDFDNEPRPIVRTTPATPYDMGADEFSTPRVGVNDGGCAYGTLSQAIAAAADGDTLQMATDSFFEAVDINDKDLTIVGGYDTDCTTYITGTTILDAAYHSGSAVDIRNNVVILRNLRITGGNAIGGGVDADSGVHVTLDNVRVTGNTGTYGAGLYVGNTAVMTLTNGTRIDHNAATVAGGGARVRGKLVIASWIGGITENTAPNGGGVSVPRGVLEMRPGHVGINQATAAEGRGGGIHVLDGGVVTATNSSNVYRNSAYDGGGIYADNAYVTLGAVIHSNTAANNGGGVYLTNHSALYAANTRIGDDGVPGRYNEATAGAGGGIYAQNSTVEFNGRVFGNRAATQGGGIIALSSTVTLTNTQVGGTGENQANDVTGGIFGAGLYFSDTHALLSSTVVASNTFSSGAGFGGGIVVWNGSVVTLTDDSRVEHHYAPNVWMFGGAGAGMLVYSSTVTLDNSQVLSNTADIGGAGVYMVLTSTLNVQSGSVIANNHVITGPGGGIAASGAPDLNISNATLRNNTAGTDGGAIYIEGGTLDFTGGWNLLQNTAGGNGGAVAVSGNAEANFRAGGYSFVYFNRAMSGHGGMVYLGNNTTTRLYATAGDEMYIYGNRAIGGNGGVLYADNGGLFDVFGQVNFDRNRADNGGAIYLTGGARVWFDDYATTRPQLWDNWADLGSGGALYAQDSPRVDCDGAIFGQAANGNHASVSGGAIYLSGSAFDADNCTFQDNEAQQHGGAIAAYTSTLSIYATYPALPLAAQPVGIERDLLSPAAPAATTCNPRTEQCSAFFGNIADSNADDTGDGGAIYTNDSTLRINHTYLHRNSAYRGGAIFQTGANAAAQVANSLIYSNTVSQAFGAGIRRSGGAFTVTHVTLANNMGGAGFSGNVNVVTNTIAWGNAAGGFTVVPALAICNIDQSGNAGANLNPQFVAPGAGENYRLRGSSPAIDACAEGLSPDLVNTPRPFGSGYDMGAYEYGLDVAFAPDRAGSGTSPDVVVYTHTLTNTGSAADTYTLSAHSSHGWTATFDPATPIMLNGGQSTTIAVNLSVPAGVMSGTIDTLVITATSSADPGLTARVTDTTTIILPLHSLTVAMVGNGTVTRTPDQPTYLHGSVVTLTATPDSGWYFGQWSGDVSGVLPTTVVTMTADKVMTATFLATPPTYYNLTVATSGTGSGSVTPAAGVHSYLAGTLVVLQATADPGSEFVGWSGDASGTNITTTLLMDADKTATAVFNPEGVCVDVTGVTLTQLTKGDIYTDTVVQFRADIAPEAAVPYTYTVDFGAGPSAPVSTVHNPLFFSHTFPATGTHTVTFAAWSCAMAVPIDDTVEVTVVPYPVDYTIYLPLVLRGHTN